MFARVKYAISWVKTLQLAAAGGNQSDALALLDSLDPRFANNLEVQILRLSLLWQLKRFDAFLESSDEVLSRILAGKRIRPTDKKYLHAFVWTLKDTAEAALRGLPYDLYRLKKVNWPEIDLDKTSKRLKRNFPLRSHPLWEKDMRKKAEMSRAPGHT